VGDRGGVFVFLSRDQYDGVMELNRPNSVRQTVRLWLALMAAVCGVAETSSLLWGQTPDTVSMDLSPEEIHASFELLNSSVDMTEFQEPMTLQEALGKLMEQFARRDVDFPVLLDGRAFRAEAPEFNVNQASINLSQLSGPVSAKTFLEALASQINGPEATVLIRRDFLEITTRTAARRYKLSESFADRLWRRYISGTPPDAVAITQHNRAALIICSICIGMAVLGLWVVHRWRTGSAPSRQGEKTVHGNP